VSALDWVVLLATTAFIVIWGIWRYRGNKSMAGYLKGEDLSWPTIGLSVMATQASAITFLSLPGQAYEDGMRFVQFYFGLPLAMVVIAVVFVPIYYKLKVYTAYEYLEGRFDVRVRLLAAGLFLISRGLATGISIYAPAILLSSIFGWPLEATSLVVGLMVILYTVIGGSKAVSQTQKQQMLVILVGLVAAGFVACSVMPKGVGVGDALTLAGALDRVNPVDASFTFSDRYNLWSGLAGGFLLSLAYFGTDQSQVGRYLGGKDATESKLGMLMNGVLKIPMQAGILFIGVLVFVVYIFNAPPVFWNTPTLDAARRAEPALIGGIEARWGDATAERKHAAESLLAAHDADDEARIAVARKELTDAQGHMDVIRKEAKVAIVQAVPGSEKQDADFIFFDFALTHLPSGLLGLLVAVILAATMSSISSAVSSLGSTTTMDFHRRLAKRPLADAETVRLSKLYTILWGLVAIGFATFASLLDNLIQAVNILGSLFYGTVLGIFLTAFFLKRVRGTAVFIAALISEALVLSVFALTSIGFLWFNLIGTVAVMGIALVLNPLIRDGAKASNSV